MTNEVPEILRLYLNCDMDFDTLENRIISLAWDPDGREDQILIDTVLVEIFYIWDGVSDESLFRERVAEVIALQPEPAPTADSGAVPA